MMSKTKLQETILFGVPRNMLKRESVSFLMSQKNLKKTPLFAVTRNMLNSESF